MSCPQLGVFDDKDQLIADGCAQDAAEGDRKQPAIGDLARTFAPLDKAVGLYAAEDGEPLKKEVNGVGGGGREVGAEDANALQPQRPARQE